MPVALKRLVRDASAITQHLRALVFAFARQVSWLTRLNQRLFQFGKNIQSRKTDSGKDGDFLFLFYFRRKIFWVKPRGPRSSFDDLLLLLTVLLME